MNESDPGAPHDAQQPSPGEQRRGLSVGGGPVGESPAIGSPSRLRRAARVAAVTVAVLLLTYALLGAWAVVGVRTYPGWVSAASPPSDPAMNILLIGTDASPGQPGRADTLVIVHLPADRSAVYLISVPRVLQASLRQGIVQLKTTRLVGGVALTVQAVQQVTGLTMNHVIETDFDGLAELSEVVGDVTVTNPKASRADGGVLLPAGPVIIGSSTVLTFVRDHSVTDEVRNQRQRALLAAVVAKVPAALANPVNLARLPTGFLTHVSADEGIVGDLPKLLTRLLLSTRIVSISAPVLPEKSSWDRPRVDPAGMAALAAAVRDGKLATYRPRP